MFSECFDSQTHTHTHTHTRTDIHTEHSEKGEVNFEEQIFTMARINKFREIS